MSKRVYTLPCPCGCGKDMKIIVKDKGKPLVFLIENEPLPAKVVSEELGIELGIVERSFK
nr:MAG TPA: SEC-C motif-c motif containing protein, Structural [Caudoviricetes sp.]